jgi:flagellar biosynthesis protein FlhG
MPQEFCYQNSIITVGGGKGGTGKSFLAAALAIEAGTRSGSAVAIDADLGGPNLHTLLRVRENGKDLGDFFRNKAPRLEDVQTATEYPGVRLIKGSENALFLANLHQAKKLKLIRQIRGLQAQNVIVDLGTGSAFNTLDIFVIGRPGIVVVTPEPTSVENTYYFLKSCAARILKLYIKYFKIPGLDEKIAGELENGAGTLRSILASLASTDSASGRILQAALNNFRPCLVINKARGDKDDLLGRSIVDVVRRYFMIEIGLLGTLPYDERVLWSLKKHVPFTLEYPESEVSLRIRDMVTKLAKLQPNSGGVREDRRPA